MEIPSKCLTSPAASVQDSKHVLGICRQAPHPRRSGGHPGARPPATPQAARARRPGAPVAHHGHLADLGGRRPRPGVRPGRRRARADARRAGGRPARRLAAAARRLGPGVAREHRHRPEPDLPDPRGGGRAAPGARRADPAAGRPPAARRRRRPAGGSGPRRPHAPRRPPAADPARRLMAAVRLLARHGNLRLLLAAGLISLVGDWVLRVGLAYEVYALTGSTIASSAMLMASLLPQILLGSVAGVFADRWDRRATMVVTNLLLATGLLPLLLVHDARRVWIVYLVALVESCLAQFFVPAEASLLPDLVPARDLITANALNGQTRDVARLLGAACGGLVAAGLIALIRPPRAAAGASPAAPAGPGGRATVRAVWRDWVAARGSRGRSGRCASCCCSSRSPASAR